jgi:hypothetical protein
MTPNEPQPLINHIGSRFINQTPRAGSRVDHLRASLNFMGVVGRNRGFEGAAPLLFFARRLARLRLRS